MRFPKYTISLFIALACAGPAPALAERVYADSLASDSVVMAATRAIAEGRPWRATRILAPVLNDSVLRTPEVVLTAARAAAAWGGWTEVNRLLADAPWVDSLSSGEGRVLLTRSALQRNQDSTALRYARNAMTSAGGRVSKGERLVLLARSLDRLGLDDSAAAAYSQAGEFLPEIADWLRLRAAEVTASSAKRGALYAALRTPAARERVAAVEARARERSHDVAGAIAAYDSLGLPVRALRLRLGDSASTLRASKSDSAAIRDALLSLVKTRAGSAAAREALALLDESFGRLSAEEELYAARSAAAAGTAARAAQAYERAFDAGLGNSRDRFTYGSILSRLGRDRAAAAQFARVKSPASLAASAAYQHARSLLRAGEGAASRTALRQVIKDYHNDSEAASYALYLLADLATDEGRDGPAREAYREIAERYPRSTLGASAAFRAALIAYVDGSYTTAAREWDELVKKHPSSSEALAAEYWSGRAWSAAGDSATARARWKSVERRSSLSYYSMLASRRLGRSSWVPIAAADSFVAVPAVDSAFARAALLERLGMDPEAELEYAYAQEHAGSSADSILATAAAFRAHGLASRGISLAQRALALGAAADARAYRLLYPVSLDAALGAEAAINGLDPSLVAALIRQESRFNPRATSPVGARGLMQIMPRVGHTIANGLDFPAWDAALLYQPDVSLQLGTSHLADLLSGYSDDGRALAAYNAGKSRVERWSEKRGTDDPELFVERIPYRETRDYVRIIQRNRELYANLYGWQR
ncbi:MAG TPA: transglycosylase SLT domain-containing protein [Gemmatimonadaceae bacterium]|nr:transglycosylase SLT domain-containing protein [Gemmatimonadaceae bacterium]